MVPDAALGSEAAGLAYDIEVSQQGCGLVRGSLSLREHPVHNLAAGFQRKCIEEFYDYENKFYS